MNTVTEAKRRYAGFWIRLVATVIDGILLMIVTYPILYMIYGSGYFRSKELFYGFFDFLVSFVLPSIAIVLFWKYKSATPGKMMVYLKVVDEQPDRPLNTERIGRYLAYILSALPLGLGFLWIALDKKKQGWHDKLAKTFVVRG